MQNTRNKHVRNKGKHGRPQFNQAEKIINKFGGEPALAKLLGMHRCQVYKWNYARPYGTDGIIPSDKAHKIRDLARLEGVLLTDADWAPERNVYEEELA